MLRLLPLALLAFSLPAAATTFVAVKAATLIGGGLHTIIPLPDGRQIDTLAMTQGFLAQGFAREEVLVFDIAKAQFLALSEFKRSFGSIQNEAGTLLERHVYDSGLGTLQGYDEYVTLQGIGSSLIEVLSQPGTIVLLEASLSATVPLPDNCPDVENPFQEDVGSIGTNPPDGIGDACQCGDVNKNGIVTADDVSYMRNHFAELPPGLDAADLDKCAVVGAATACNIRTAVFAARAVNGAPPGISQVCTAAGP